MRTRYLQKLFALSEPILNAASKGNLKKTMKLEQKPEAGREPYAVLEAVGRLLCGIAPWFEATPENAGELTARDKLISQAIESIKSLTDPDSDDFADYKTYGQPFSQLLVDTAFLSQSLLRAPNALLKNLPDKTISYLLELLEASRKITPNCSNWLLFSVETELLYHRLTGKANIGMIRSYFKLFESWYRGDSWYSDGPLFTMDYYNSLVIYPILLDLCDEMPDLLPIGMPEIILNRARRHAEILERMITPEGNYIVMGRSSAYRCGVFHIMAQLAWQKRLPDSLPPASVRESLGAVIENSLQTSSFREDGFLNIGVYGHQPAIGEGYICTGSLYMASAAFLPLGLPQRDSFWIGEAQPWTQRRIWNGDDIQRDIALEKR
jgi:hypothetical protein